VAYWQVAVPLLIVLAAVVGVLVYKSSKRNREQAEMIEEAIEAERRAWLEPSFAPGTFSVVLSGVGYEGSEDGIASLLVNLPDLRDQPFPEIADLVERAIHVSPQTVAQGIAQHDAVRLKEKLELSGARVRINEGTPRPSSPGRKPIPAQIRREVWRRDNGRCVDCGSRERLEYDHIIALANGGSNTARNIELRCESCNRKKAATI